jgi:hypothetical protein
LRVRKIDLIERRIMVRAKIFQARYMVWMMNVETNFLRMTLESDMMIL